MRIELALGNEVELEGLAIHGEFAHAAAVERPPAFGAVHAADDVFDSGWIFQGVAGAFDLTDVLGVEGELAQLAISLDEVDRDEVAAGCFDQLTDAGGLGHGTGARGLTVGLVLLSCTIDHSWQLGKSRAKALGENRIHNPAKNPFRGWIDPMREWSSGEFLTLL